MSTGVVVRGAIRHGAVYTVYGVYIDILCTDIQYCIYGIYHTKYLNIHTLSHTYVIGRSPATLNCRHSVSDMAINQPEQDMQCRYVCITVVAIPCDLLVILYHYILYIHLYITVYTVYTG